MAPNPTNLQWFVSGTSQWGTPFTADTWFNFAYDIDVGSSRSSSSLPNADYHESSRLALSDSGPPLAPPPSPRSSRTLLPRHPRTPLTGISVSSASSTAVTLKIGSSLACTLRTDLSPPASVAEAPEPPPSEQPPPSALPLLLPPPRLKPPPPLVPLPPLLQVPPRLSGDSAEVKFAFLIP